MSELIIYVHSSLIIIQPVLQNHRPMRTVVATGMRFKRRPSVYESFSSPNLTPEPTFSPERPSGSGTAAGVGAGGKTVDASAVLGFAVIVLLSMAVVWLAKLQFDRRSDDTLYSGRAEERRRRGRAAIPNPELALRPVNDLSTLDNSAICSVCLEPLRNGTPVSALRCSHLFHESCLLSWFMQGSNGLTSACPICRLAVVEEGGGGIHVTSAHGNAVVHEDAGT